jgi:phosphoglycolate phosphatase
MMREDRAPDLHENAVAAPQPVGSSAPGYAGTGDAPRAVIFDLDGTLVDTAPDLHRILEQVLAELDLPAPPIGSLRTMVGDGARVLIVRALAEAGVELGPAQVDRLYDRFLALYSAEPCRASRAFEHARDVLAGLAAEGWRLGVCTNKPQGPTEGLLAALGLAPCFGAVLGGDVVASRKPHPDHLRAVIAALGGRPESTVMVGDSRNDLLAARALGIPCVLVSFGYTAVPAYELGADRVIDSFADLAAALGSLRSAA